MNTRGEMHSMIITTIGIITTTNKVVIVPRHFWRYIVDYIKQTGTRGSYYIDFQVVLFRATGGCVVFYEERGKT